MTQQVFENYLVPVRVPVKHAQSRQAQSTRKKRAHFCIDPFKVAKPVALSLTGAGVLAANSHH
ncbi:hypothetical protein [uncultured Bartonella sp.]|uniref:hypothetical protein n=1 Tax=uncultured Bartonella sp. TaxID=104108 RepID=UPI0026278136|nr:hypothetical protein [uncultured Bartonella sp.]